MPRASGLLPSFPPEGVPLQTVRVDNEVTLRPLAVTDAGAFFELIDANRDHLSRWIPVFGFVHSVEDERVALEGMHVRQREGDMLGGAIEYLGHLVGCVGLSGLNSEDRVATLGYWIVEDMQGRGIVTRACLAVLERAFDQRAANRVEIRVAALNHRSRAVAERLGFALAGVLRRRFLCNGRWHDLAVYSLPASEWTPPAC